MTPYYKIVVNENDETGVDINSLVFSPAHQKQTTFYSEQTAKYQFDEEKRLVMGVMIASDLPIERFDENIGTYYVEFDSPTIEIINRKIAKNGFSNNVNLNHDPNSVVDGVYQTQRFIVSNSNPKYADVPEFFKEQNINDGSLMAEYYVENDEVWEMVKAGKFRGYSIELNSGKKLINKYTMSKQEKFLDKFMSTMKGLFNEGEATPAEPAQVPNEEAKFSIATTAEGLVYNYEGDIADGVTVFTVDDGSGVQIPAPEGNAQITLEDGKVLVVQLDATGLLVSSSEMDGEVESEVEDMQKAMSEMSATFAEQINALKSENKELKETVSKFSELQENFTKLEAKLEGAKFEAQPKAGEPKAVKFEEMTAYQKFREHNKKFN